jgi:hypothetical protein
MNAALKITPKVTAASLIRMELKQTFPGIKFSVNTKSDSVRIGWSNGPTEESVNEIVDKYEYGTFDGMEDLYKYDNRRDDIPQVKYVFAQRNIDNSIYIEAFELARKVYRDLEGVESIDDNFIINGCNWNGWRWVGVKINRMDLTKGFNFETFKGAAQ